LEAVLSEKRQPIVCLNSQSLAGRAEQVKRTVRAQDLARLDLLQEVGLLLLGASGEALLLGLVDGVLDGLALGGGAGLGLALLGAVLLALAAAQLPPELGAVAAAVVEVGGVCCGMEGLRSVIMVHARVSPDAVTGEQAYRGGLSPQRRRWSQPRRFVMLLLTL
jgi:hypothetical protein